MIKVVYAVIDPKLDRPCFSSDPPPATLVRTPGMLVVRYEFDLPDPAAPVQVCSVASEEEARQRARELYERIKEPRTKP